MIDFHCHLDLYEDPRSVLEKVVEKEFYVLAVTTTPLAWEGTCALIGGAPGIRAAAGLHPELVAARHNEVDQLCGLMSKTQYVGEVGLDGSRSHRPSLPIQRKVFEAVLSACESLGGRIITIHSRGATSLVLDHLEAHGQAGIPVMHWFSGTHGELRRAIELGCWFSVGPAMLRGEKGQRLTSLMPTDRVLTETDGPFARRGSDPLMPWDAVEAERVLAAMWGISPVEAEEALRINLRALVASVEDLP